MLNRLRGDGENGAVLVLTAMLLLVLMGFAALAVDAASAWSKRRQIETAADIGVLAGAEAIVGTFLSDVDAAVSGVVTDLVAVNSPEALAVVGPVTGPLDPDGPDPCADAQRDCLTNVTVTVSGTSDNAFAPAIGAADTIQVSSGDGEGTTEAQIYQIEYSSLKLFPIGIDSMAVGLRCGAPECRAHDQPTPPPPPSTTTTTTTTPPPPPPPPAEPPPVIADPVVDEVDLVGVGRGRNCSDQAVAQALAEGVPHLVAVDAAAAVRDEGAACSDGHELTMPNAAYGRISEPVSGSLLAQGIHRVITTGPPLWTYLTGVGLCSGADIEAITDPDPEVRFSLQTRAMQQCLRNGSPSFDFSGIDPMLGRLGWGILLTDLNYREFVPVFVHSLVGPSPDYVVTESPEAGASGYTVFVLNEDWLPDEHTEVDPTGRLSFKLID